eukprot:753523-Hanusia_phi.AAC.9
MDHILWDLMMVESGVEIRREEKTAVDTEQKEGKGRTNESHVLRKQSIVAGGQAVQKEKTGSARW